MAYNVKYISVFGDGTQSQTSYACFSGVLSSYGVKPKRIRYFAEVHDDISNLTLKLYGDFLKKVLKDFNWEYTILDKRNFPKEFSFDWDRVVEFSLDTTNYIPVKVLMYLTAFRLVKEYPEIVNKLFRDAEKLSLEELFIRFQQVHADASDGKLSIFNGNLSGHGLMYYSSYGGCSGSSDPFNPLTLCEFYANLKKNTPDRVQKFFLKTLTS